MEEARAGSRAGLGWSGAPPRHSWGGLLRLVALWKLECTCTLTGLTRSGAAVINMTHHEHRSGPRPQYEGALHRGASLDDYRSSRSIPHRWLILCCLHGKWMEEVQCLLLTSVTCRIGRHYWHPSVLAYDRWYLLKERSGQRASLALYALSCSIHDSVGVNDANAKRKYAMVYLFIPVTTNQGKWE